MTAREQRQYALPERLVTPAEADHDRLEIKPGPWLEDQWVLVQVGDSRRYAKPDSWCQVPSCEGPVHYRTTDDFDLCYAHYEQWRRSDRPQPVGDWATRRARKPVTRNQPNSIGRRAIDFSIMPPKIAREIRYVVSMKVHRGDWTPNRGLLQYLERLIEVALNDGAATLLSRRPEDWLILMTDRAPMSSERRDLKPYNRTFFSELHRGLVADPWSLDSWLWRGVFEEILGDGNGAYQGPLHWHRIEQEWLREPLKQLAKRSLIDGTRAWGTLGSWVRGFAMLSRYLSTEGVEAPEELDREMFLDYLSSLRESGATKRTMSLANTVASTLGHLRADNYLAELGSEVYLRYAENKVDKIREPRPYPEDVVRQIDQLVVGDEELPLTVRRMLRFNRWAGCRISELVTMPIDCLRHNGTGHWVYYYMPKVKDWRRFPVPADLADLLLEQQEVVRTEYGAGAEHMFPSAARSSASRGVTKPWSTSGFRRAVSKSFKRNGINVSSVTGEQVSGGHIHRYRHTVGMNLLNSSWSQPEVQRFFGHASPTMTSHYAEIVDSTLTAKAEQFFSDRLVNPAGEHSDPVVEALQERMYFALPDGSCSLPTSQKCDVRDNPCQDCAFFRPGGADVVEVHQNRARRLRLLIESAEDPATIAMNEQALQKVEGFLAQEARDED